MTEAEELALLRRLAASLVASGHASNEPWWDGSDDANHESEWWPVGGDAQRLLWEWARARGKV